MPDTLQRPVAEWHRPGEKGGPRWHWYRDGSLILGDAEGNSEVYLAFGPLDFADAHLRAQGFRRTVEIENDWGNLE